MKTIAVHSIFQYPKNKHKSNIYSVTNDVFEKTINQIENSGYEREIVAEEENRKKVRLTKKWMKDSLEEDGYVVCHCGFKGNAPLQMVSRDKGYASEERYIISCPSCGNHKFEKELDYFHGDNHGLSYADIYRDDDKVSLSFAIRTYRSRYEDTEEGRKVSVSSFQTPVRLTYNIKKRCMYLVIPKKRVVRNLSYGNTSDFQTFLLDILMEDEKGKNMFVLFMKRCFLLADINAKVKKNIFKSLDKYPTYWFGKSRGATAKRYLPLLAHPPLSAMEDEQFVLSLPTAPRRIKQAIARSDASIQNIFRNMYGFCNKRLLRFYNQRIDNLAVVDFFRPLFRNEQFLMDLVTKINHPDELVYNNRFLVEGGMAIARSFAIAQNVRKEKLPIFRELKKTYKDELKFRNALMEVLDHCNGSITDLFQYLEDIRLLENELLTILPPSRLPKRHGLVALHDAYVKTIHDNRAILEAMEIKKNGYEYTEEELALDYQEGDVSIALARSPKELANIGVALNNCVRTYDRNVRCHVKHVLSLKEDGVPRVCIELRQEQEGWTLMQCSGWRNGSFSETFLPVLSKWMVRNDIKDPRCIIPFSPIDTESKNRKVVQMPVVEQEAQPIPVAVGETRTVLPIERRPLVSRQEIVIVEDDLPF